MRPLRALLIAAVAAVALAVPGAAAPVKTLPGQTIDLKVLLISADGTEPGFGAWKAELDREGVPYDTLVAYTGQTRTATLTDARLADYATDHAHYQAVILASGDLGHTVTNPGGSVSYLSALSDAEWASLARFERSFGIRQLSDYTAPSPAHGLNSVGGASQDGVQATLTPTGKAAFPYLKGPVAIADDDPTVPETFGYPATPVASANWQTLLAGPGDTAFLGIYTHPDDGREEMVMTVASNQFQNHNQLLRHGMLNWVTRGVFLGYQRNYLEFEVDDLFLGDDTWDPAAHATDYDPAHAIRMTPADVDQAVAWSKAHGLRLDMVFNGGGSELYKQDTGSSDDPLADKVAQPAVKAAFGFINHTYDHPNLDCSTAPYIASEISDNLAWAGSHGLPVTNATEVVTGEHSGLANSRPGNPGTIDPPSLDPIEVAPTGGAIPGGSYDYALTAHSPAGETVASIAAGIAVGAAGTTTNSAAVSFNAVCHATSYSVYRSPAGANSWSLVASLARSATAPTDDGSDPIELTVLDTAATGTAASLPTANAAALAPYGQNPNFLAGLAAAHVTTVASDASKGYPPAPAGAAFVEGAVQAVPRYPSNVYYNVAKQGQQLDEYNWIYVDPAHGGGCVPITGVTTCRTTPATWAEYVTSEDRVMFGHVVGNDPRPHFVHQSNLAGFVAGLPETDANQGGILYPVADGLLARYESDFDRSSAPLLQLDESQIGQVLAQQSAWTATRVAGTVTAWLQDGRVHVRNTGAAAVDVPLTGTTAGTLYGGQKSGWTTLAAGAEQVLSPNDPANVTAPSITGTARVGETLTAAGGDWTGTPTIVLDHQWQRCDAHGAGCVNLAGATAASYTAVADDAQRTLRVVVLAGNWISSVSQAASAPTGVVADPPPPPPASPAPHENPGAGPSPGSGPSGSPGAGGARRPARLALTRLRMTPRRFPVAHRSAPRGTRLDGARITWTLNAAAKVRLSFQRRARHGRWVRVGTITRPARAGAGVVRFTGRFGRHLLAPRRYRLVVTASAPGQPRTASRALAFRVLKG
jgi:hypothetical protein